MPPQEVNPPPEMTKNQGSPPVGPAAAPPVVPTPVPNMPASPPSPPQAPNQFDFMLKDPQAAPAKFGFLPADLSSKNSILVIATPVVLIIMVLVLLLGGSGGGNYDKVVDLAAQNREIIRVSTVFQNQFSETIDLNIETTAVSTLNTQQQQILSYLAKIKYKYKPGVLAQRTNKSTDAALKDAIKNNKFDQSYLTYLNAALRNYQSSMNTVAQTSSKNFDKILSNAYKSNQVLLASPQFASLSGS